MNHKSLQRSFTLTKKKEINTKQNKKNIAHVNISLNTICMWKKVTKRGKKKNKI